jgi:hypothetical protein
VSVYCIFRLAWKTTLVALLIGGGVLLWMAEKTNTRIDGCYDDYSPAYIHDEAPRTAWCAQNQ